MKKSIFSSVLIRKHLDNKISQSPIKRRYLVYEIITKYKIPNNDRTSIRFTYELNNTYSTSYFFKFDILTVYTLILLSILGNIEYKISTTDDIILFSLCENILYGSSINNSFDMNTSNKENITFFDYEDITTTLEELTSK